MSRFSQRPHIPPRRKQTSELQSRSMTPLETVYHIHEHLVEKGFGDYKCSINGVDLDFAHEGDVLNCLALFLTNPLDRFTIELSSSDFSIQIYRNSKASAAICKSKPFGFLARSVTRHIYRLIHPYNKTYFHDDIKTVLALYYGSVQFAALRECKTFIQQTQLDTEWSRAILEQPDDHPLIFDRFVVLLEKFSTQDRKELSKYRKKADQHQTLRLLYTIDLLEGLNAVIINGKIPALVSEHYGSLDISRGRRYIMPVNTLEGMLYKGRYVYDGFKIDQMRLLATDQVQTAPAELDISLEQLAFIEQQITQQGVSGLDIHVRLHHMKEEWKRLRKP